MDEIELLDNVLNKTAGLIEGVGDDQWDRPSPCEEMNARQLVEHLVGWLASFEAGSQGRKFEGDATAYKAGDDPAGDYRTTAAGLLAGWKEHGFDREVPTSSGDTMPATMVFNMTVMEEMTHGWDLARATGQPIPYTAEEAADVYARATKTLPPQYQGEGMPFGAIVPVSDDAPAIDRLIGFMGRDPS
jgi:uncharacterized protein (TIGR03086 family)